MTMLAEGRKAVAPEGVEYGVVDPAVAIRRRHAIFVNIARVALLVVVLVLWQILGPIVGKIAASSPMAMFSALIDMTKSGVLWVALEATMVEVVLGYALGVVCGIVIGGISASFKPIAEVLDPYIMALYGVPKIAIGPILVVWFGIGLTPKVMLSALMVFFLVFYSTYHGIREVDQAKITAIRLMGATPLQVRRYVIFPAAMPSIYLGLKIGVPEALVGAIVGEFISSTKGLGYEIQFATAQLDTASVFAGLFVLTVLSLILNGIVNATAGRNNK